MEQRSENMSRTLKATLLIIALIVTIVVAYVALTYPRTVVSFPVSFTLGADVEERDFDMPILHRWVQIEVAFTSGTALWTAKIESGSATVWSDSAHQASQTTYKSGWIELPSGSYNFTFATAGGSLEAEITVTSKGGFW